MPIPAVVKKIPLVTIVAVLAQGLLNGSVAAQTGNGEVLLSERSSGITTTATVLASAVPDEDYAGIADSKTNEAYVWGMVPVGDKIYFGTVANTLCLVLGTFLDTTTPVDNDAYACEFGDSASSPPLPAALGDARVPSLYVFDRAVDSLLALDVDASDEGRLQQTIGIRAAGEKDGVVLFAGVSLAGGINVFAFDSATDAFIASGNFPDYTNIRKFRFIQDELYAGVGFTDGTGRVLRWTGNAATPLSFEEVGETGSEVGELVEHEGRIFVTTWPDAGTTNAALYMSPLIDADGQLDTSDATLWTEQFSVNDYEADPITAAVYGLGALASFDGFLFWGSMHVPGTSTLAHASVLGTIATPTTPRAPTTEDILNSERAISIFRGTGFGAGSPQIDVLYGYEAMPVLDVSTGEWNTEANNLGPILRGLPGFGNLANNYTWTMAVFDDRLWVGTMDASGIFTLPQSVSGLPTGLLANAALGTFTGADLYFFNTPDSAALAESLNGLGNAANYGIRTMVADGDELLIGTANPFNLLQDNGSGTDKLDGGWELISLSVAPQNTPIGATTVTLEDGFSVEFCDVTSAGRTGVLVYGDGPIERELINAINGAPDNGIRPSEINFGVSIASTAGIGTDGACASQPAVLTIDLETPLYKPRLVRVTFDPLSGGLNTEDITLSTREQRLDASYPLTTRLTGALDSNFSGVILLLSDERPTAVPTLPPLWLALLLLSVAAVVCRIPPGRNRYGSEAA